LLAVAGSSYVHAQQRFEGPDGFRDGGPRIEYRHRLSADDVSAFTDARIAALKAGLKLTPDQEKNWPAFETAVRNLAQLRVDRIKAREAGAQQPPASPFERLARRADNMSKASAALKQIADAGKPLYASLDDAQKEPFTLLAHMLRPRPMGGPMGGWRREGGDFDRDGRGFGPRWGHQGDRFGDNDAPNGGMHRMMDDDDAGDQL
jgi:zinc resistance-associated protein